MYLKKINIGKVTLDNNIFLAPMAGITNLPFRLICEKFLPGLVYTEMISSKGLFYQDKKTNKLLNMKNENNKIAIQIFGSDIEAMGYSAKKISSMADILDINMGCPAPKIVKNGDGSKLMQNIDLAYEIIKEVVKNSEAPVSVKIRKGWDQNSINAVEFAQMIEQAGASCIEIHGRTRSEFYSGKADWNIIEKVKQAVKIPVIGNGDIKCPKDALMMFEQTGVDGIMIGRAAIGNPWIFKQIENYLQGKTVQEVSYKEKLDIILEHIDMQIDELGENIGIKEMRKYLCFYLKNLSNASNIRQQINCIEKESDLKECIIEYFKSLGI